MSVNRYESLLVLKLWVLVMSVKVLSFSCEVLVMSVSYEYLLVLNLWVLVINLYECDTRKTQCCIKVMSLLQMNL